MKLLRKISLYWNTIKYFKRKQIVYQFYYRVRKAKIDLNLPNNFNHSFHERFASPLLKNKNYIDASRFIFLNTAVEYGDALWGDKNHPDLWLYNLHYFDYLNTDNAVQNKLGASYIEKWLKFNPVLIGLGWKPYPLSLRIVNWIRYVIREKISTSTILESLYLQLRALEKQIEHHILGNHIFENYKALCIGGLFFSGKEAQRWFEIGFKGLSQEINEQILEDGGHFELSPMYHAIILEDMLDLYNFFQAYNKDFPKLWLDKMIKMFDWLNIMCHPDGEISFFNDATFGVAPTLKQLAQYADRLNIELPDDLSKEEFVHLKQSGFIRIKLEKLYMIIGVGKIGPDYQPGHAHADSLSYEISYAGKRYIVNSGINQYGLSDERLRQRGTCAHNCLVVNQENSSEVWSGFRVARRANAFVISIDQSNSEYKIKVGHDGYKRNEKGKACYRTFLIKVNEVDVIDEYDDEDANLESYVHFHPNISGKTIEKIFSSKSQIIFDDYRFHPGFSLSDSAIQAKISGKKIVQYHIDFRGVS